MDKELAIGTSVPNLSSFFLRQSQFEVLYVMKRSNVDTTILLVMVVTVVVDTRKPDVLLHGRPSRVVSV